MSAKIQAAILTNIIGAVAAFGFAWLYFRADLESVFNPVLTEIRTEYISRDNGMLRFRLKFFKARAAKGVVNSWKMDPDGNTEGGELFFTPEKCIDDEPLKSGNTKTNEYSDSFLCADIPKSLREKSFTVSGLIIYKLDASGLTVPTMIPSFDVPIR